MSGTSGELEDFGEHYRRIANAVLRGGVVLFLGAGINLCERPYPFSATIRRNSVFEHAEINWKWSEAQSTYLPASSELAEYLAKEFDFPGAEACAIPGCSSPQPVLDLARVSQYANTVLGGGRLHDALHSIFAKKYPITFVHRFIASLAKATPKQEHSQSRYSLIVTTNYDDLVERALTESGQEFDLVYYDPFGPEDQPKRSFWHQQPERPARVIASGSGCRFPFFKERPVVLKIHGTVDTKDASRDRFVITETHYIEYLADTPLEKLLPSLLLDKLRNSHLLFLGYSLRDWNFRVFLHRLKRNPTKDYKAWALRLDADEAERDFWLTHGVKIIPENITECIQALSKLLPQLEFRDSPNG